MPPISRNHTSPRRWSNDLAKLIPHKRSIMYIARLIKELFGMLIWIGLSYLENLYPKAPAHDVAQHDQGHEYAK
jgi:hypothetical protein